MLFELGAMRSKASFRSHPIHPSLIPFPFAFLVGAFVFDALASLLSKPEFSQTARHLAVAGIATGLVAAVPGVIDFLYSVPPASSGRARAVKHALANVSALVLFAVGYWLRGPDDPGDLPVLVLELVAVVALIYAGWQGGVLVTRNMIGVDHRYAHAGKWSEETHDPHENPLVVAHKDDLKPGQMRLLRVGGERIALARTESGYCAFQDHCTHRGASLADGVLIDGVVQCLWHGSRFECESGKVAGGPAKKSLKTYEVEERNGDVVLKIE